MPFLLQGRANFLKCFLRLFFACALYHLPISEVFTCSSDFYFQEKLQLLFTECDENFVFLKTTSWQLQQDVLMLIVYFFGIFPQRDGDLWSCPPITQCLWYHHLNSEAAMLSINYSFPNSYFQASSRQFCFTFSNAIQFRGDWERCQIARMPKFCRSSISTASQL